MAEKNGDVIETREKLTAQGMREWKDPRTFGFIPSFPGKGDVIETRGSVLVL